LDAIPGQHIEEVIEQLDLSSVFTDPRSLLKCARLVHTEKLWESLAKMKWQDDLDIGNHGCSWKRLYLERHCEQLFEQYYPSPDNSNWDILLENVNCAGQFIHTLKISQVLTHLPIEDAVRYLPNLSTLDISYGCRSMGIQFDKNQIGMTLDDAHSLNKCLSMTRIISNLKLCESGINDEFMILIAHGLEQNDTITSLDLSHNSIANKGAMKIGYWINREVVLTHLTLSDNRIGFDGIKSIADGVQSNVTLLKLDIRLNNIGDEGGAYLFTCLTKNQILEELNVSSNSLGPLSAVKFINLIKTNRSLQRIDASCNPISMGPSQDEDEQLPLEDQYKVSIKQNTTIIKLDLRKTGLSKETLSDINEFILPRYREHKQALRKSFLNQNWEDIDFPES